MKQIASILSKRIKDYDKEIKADDIGEILSVGDGIAIISGLNKAMSSELIEFENGSIGMVMNLEKDSVGAIILGDEKNLKQGQRVRRTNRIIEVKVGDELLGRVVNALGEAIDGLGEIKSDKYLPIERVAPGVMTRKSVHESLKTGIKIIDGMIPIGKGQRELIIGDRQTGKTALALDTIINQKGENVKCVYVAIGQKASSIALLVEKLKEKDALDYTTVVVASASDSAPMQYIAPYAGVAIAEYWLSKGEDVLIVYDDLSKHAVAYRSISLLLRRPPGREAYPGDVFYLHSRLLERACKLNEEHGGGSISALPIIETQAGDISAYIPTNVISITDGQIFLQNELFNAGIRPAVDSGLSVSRVGSAAQEKAVKKVSSSLKLELAQYNELLSFTQFGSDLDPVSAKIINHGKKLVELLKQQQYAPFKMEEICISIFLAKNAYIDDIEISDIKEYEAYILEELNNKYAEIVERIKATKDLDKENELKLHEAIKQLSTEFKKIKGYSYE